MLKSKCDQKHNDHLANMFAEQKLDVYQEIHISTYTLTDISYQIQSIIFTLIMILDSNFSPDLCHNVFLLLSMQLLCWKMSLKLDP